MRLREEQDRELRESMEADRLENMRREQERLQQQREDEERMERVREEEAIEMSRRLSHDDVVCRLRDYFQNHPEPLASDTANVATIRFQLPRGTKLSRRFLKTDTAQVDAVAIYIGM